tara:strand:- start:123 stop:323 length:201 start_codon:yes stop_codon:yes gene_type:complete
MVQGPRKGKMKSSPSATTLAYTPLSEKEKEAEMRKVIKNLHDTNYTRSGFGGSSSNFGPAKLKEVD